MCGRAYLTFSTAEFQARFSKELSGEGAFSSFKHILSPNYNLAPSQLTPIIIVRDQKRIIETAKWGIIPFKLKPSEKPKFAPINAKSETVNQLPMFRESFRFRRCIVPFSGFYEWMRCDQTKRPYKIHLKDQPIMSVAGIYASHTLENGEVIDTFAILTTEANDQMKRIHERMPVLLDAKYEERWLDPKLNDSNELDHQLKSILATKTASTLITVEVSTLVNSPANNSPEVLNPLDESTPNHTGHKKRPPQSDQGDLFDS